MDRWLDLAPLCPGASLASLSDQDAPGGRLQYLKKLLHVGPDVIPTFVQKNSNKQKNPLSLVLFCAWAVGGAVLRIGYGTDRWRRSV